MRLLIGALAVATLVACGSAPSRSVRRARARAPRTAAAASPTLSAGTVYRIDHDVEERLDGALVRVRRTRVVLWVRERRPDGGFDATATLTRQEEGSEEIARAVVALQLARDGTLRRDPELLCDRADDDLFASRFIRHVVAPYPRGGREELFVEQREQPLAAEVRERELQRRAEATLELDEDLVAGVHATGAMRARVIADVDAVDPLAFDVRARIEGTPTVRDPEDGAAGVRPRALRIDEHTRSARTDIGIDAPRECGEEFSIHLVVEMIRRRQLEIRQCYERVLAMDPQTQGRVKISMTIEPDGSVTGVRIVESTITGSYHALIDQCVRDVVASFWFDLGPTGGSVTYQFPFVFEPQQ